MKISWVDRPPYDVRTFDDPDAGSAELGDRLGAPELDQICQIFQTPLTGAYSWSYQDCDAKIRRLYELGKSLNWNASWDVDWSATFPRDDYPLDESTNPFQGFPAWEAFDEATRLEFSWHNLAWLLSQFLHGEQGALLVASQLVSCAPTFESKLYAGSQTFDEARHVEVFSRYMRDKVRMMYPINPHLKALLDKILTDPRWDLKFIGMQIIVEGLALAAFQTMRLSSRDPQLTRIIELVLRDESRHVAFGVLYLEQFVKSLSEQEREERAQFAYEACVVMRERLIARRVHERFGFDTDRAREHVLTSGIMAEFTRMLFMRVMPNLKKIGLLTDTVRPKFEELGILEYEDFVNDGMIDWAVLEEPIAKVAPAAAE